MPDSNDQTEIWVDYSTLQVGDTFQFQCRRWRADVITRGHHERGRHRIRIMATPLEQLTQEECVEMIRNSRPSSATDLQEGGFHALHGIGEEPPPDLGTQLVTGTGLLTAAEWAERNAGARGLPWPDTTRQYVSEMTANYARRSFYDSMYGVPPDLPADRCRGMEEREIHFMLRNAGRIEGDLRWLRNNDTTVCRVYQQTKRAGLSETTAAELALIRMARRCEDLHRQNSKLRAAMIKRPMLEPEYMI